MRNLSGFTFFRQKHILTTRSLGVLQVEKNLKISKGHAL